MIDDGSILIEIKKMLGLMADDETFDVDVIIHINSAFSRLNQLGVGPAERFRIQGSNETWDDFWGEKTHLMEVKDYIYLQTKLMFDPPTGGILGNYEAQITKLEWLLNAASDPTDEEKEHMGLKPLWG